MPRIIWREFFVHHMHHRGTLRDTCVVDGAIHIRLAGLREAREEAKRLLANGQGPSLIKRLSKAAKVATSANTFNTIAAELLDKKRREEKADTT
jgi:hypothetical protein